MKPTRLNDCHELEEIFSKFVSKKTLTNCYMLPNELRMHIERGVLSALMDKVNLYLLLDKGNCNRVYYYINNPDEVPFLESDKPMMLELLYRGEDPPYEMTDYWVKAGFSLNLTRDQYSITFKDFAPLQENSKILIEPANAETGKYAQCLFNEVFDQYSGDFISDKELAALLSNDRLMIATTDEAPVGALHHYMVGKSAWIGHVAVSEQSRGLHTGGTLVNAFIRYYKNKGITRGMLWVQKQNRPAVSMYQNAGFKWTGKSTLSMIKTK